MTDKLRVTRKNFLDLAHSGGEGQFFYVRFIKRTTSEEREFTCRTGVKKHLKGGTKGYDDETKGLVTVHIAKGYVNEGDNVEQRYRSVPVENVIELRANRRTYQVIDGYFVKV